MAVTQSERAEVPPSHRSIVPSIPGVPAGAAVLIAVTCTFIGFFIDARGGSELTGTFAALYVLGCVLAVLAVRYRGLFTTMVLPPLLLFVSVPLAYQQMLGSSGGLELKNILLNLAIPLVNRFPTMALATVLVLIIGAVRIYLHRREQDGSSGELRKPRTRTARPARAARAQRTRPADSKDPARRRFRSDPEHDDSIAAEPAAAPSRRPAGRTADRPPRVGKPADRQGRKPAGANPAAARQAGERKRNPADRRATPDRKAAARQPATDRKPPADRRAAGANPAAQAPEARRRRNPNNDVPPHPRPNVRYRERDSGRIER
ncbi:DUF6542 domain-containing protein [Nocardia sp. IFM 10818]